MPIHTHAHTHKRTHTLNTRGARRHPIFAKETILLLAFHHVLSCLYKLTVTLQSEEPYIF